VAFKKNVTFFDFFVKNACNVLIFIIFASVINKTLKEMKELVEKIQEKYAAFATDAALQVEKGNKAAGTRARKASLELEKLMKEFRKASLEAAK
jgi:hypothetical protein